MGMKPKRDMAGRWEYPPLYAEMAAVVIDEVEKYVLRHQNTIAQYITTRTILEVCLVEEHHPGSWVS